MEGGALLDPAFAGLAKEGVLYCHITSRVPGDRHPDLLEEKGGKGFPHFAILDASGAVQAVHGGARTPADFARTLAAVRKALDLKPKADAGDRAARIEALGTLLDSDLLSYADAARRLREIGDAGSEAPRLQAGVALARLKEEGAKMVPARRLRDAEAVLARRPDSDIARWHAHTAAVELQDSALAARHAVEGVRSFPTQEFFLRQAADFYLKKAFSPVGIGWLKAGLALPGQGGDAFKDHATKTLQAYAPSGGDAWEGAPLSGPVAGCETAVYRAAGANRDPARPWDEHVAVCSREGVPHHAFRQFRSKDQVQIWLVTLDGSELLREKPAGWTRQEFEAIVSDVHRALPRILDASRFRRRMIWPLAHRAAVEALAADPGNPGLQKLLQGLAPFRWDAVEVAGEKPGPGGTVLRIYRPAGQAPVPATWTDEALAVLLSPDGAFLRAYALQTGPANPTRRRYLTFRDDSESFLVRQLPAVPSMDDLAAAALAAEGALASLRTGREALAQAQKSDYMNPEFDAAVAALKAALKADPQLLAAADDLAKAYLAMSDRVRDADRTDDLYPRAVGALRFLARLDPEHPTVSLLSGIYAYRFLNYPQALLHLKRAGGERAEEILSLLRETGHGEYKAGPPWDLDGLTIEPFDRVHGSEQAEKSVEGVQWVERSFVGSRDGVFRFCASYRVQKIGPAVKRDLVLNRYERPYLLKEFEAEPSPEALREEITKAIRSLKSDK